MPCMERFLPVLADMLLVENLENDFAEVKTAMVGLVAATTAKVTGKVLTADDQKRLNDETIKEIAA